MDGVDIPVSLKRSKTPTCSGSFRQCQSESAVVKRSLPKLTPITSPTGQCNKCQNHGRGVSSAVGLPQTLLSRGPAKIQTVLETHQTRRHHILKKPFVRKSHHRHGRLSCRLSWQSIGVTTSCAFGVTELVRTKQSPGADELAGQSSTDPIILGTTAALSKDMYRPLIVQSSKRSLPLLSGTRGVSCQWT